MKRITRNDLLGSYPVFLLQITWGARVYRFSTYPINIQKDDGTSIHFSGGLEDPDLDESLNSLDKNPEKNTLPVELVFDVNLIEEFFKYGRTLDGAKGELSMVTERDNSILQTYENRIKLFSGDIIQPIIGSPDRPSGYAAFTIERNPQNQASPIITTQGIFRANVSVSTPIPIEFSDGFVYPIVFGAPHNFLSIGALGVASFETCYATPAFIIRKELTITGVGNYEDFTKFWLCIAYGEVDAETVTIRDYQNNIKAAKTVQKITTSSGKIISYVEMQFAEWNGGSPILIDGIVNPWMTEGGYSTAREHGTALTDEPQYYVSWDDGGGLLNPYGDGYLEGGGDVILFFLDMSGVDIDKNAWRNVANFLNKWKFGGYINDPEITPYQFLLDNIFPFLPVQAVNGADGLRPVIPLLYSSQIPRSIYNAEIGIGFYFVSPVDWTSEPDDIINRILLRYGFCLFLKNNPAFIQIDNNLNPDHYTGTTTSTITAQTSFSEYGDRYQEQTAGYIYDWKTATKTAQLLIRQQAFPKMSMQIQADSQYGWLQLGDILSVTSSGYFMDGYKMQITEKSWKNGSWLFVVELENNVIINDRG